MLEWNDLDKFAYIDIDDNGNDVIRKKKTRGRPKKTGVERYSGGGIRKRPKVTSNIIGVDGEGEKRDGPSGPMHTYTLICASNGKDFKKQLSIPKDYANKRARTSQRQANYGLRTLPVFEFLLSFPPNSLVVGFAFQYDFVKIISDLPKEHVEQLCTNDKRTEWIIKYKGEKKHYGIEYVPRKQLIIKEGKSFQRNKNGSWKVKWDRKVTVWDVFGFFQASFVRTLDKWNMADKETLDRIQAMKEQRFDFTQCTEEQIEEYCFEECDYLVKLVREFLTHVEAVGLNLKRFDGAGALAGAWMKKQNIKSYLSDTNLDEEIALQGYYGGRFEISKIGHVGPVYSHDINSAYPYIAKDLPCLAHGEFKKTTKFKKGAWGIYRASYYGKDNDFAALPWRSKEGFVFYKNDVKDSEGYRWVWQSEIQPILDNEPDNLKIHEGYYWISECEHKPFQDIQTMYDYRLAINPETGVSRKKEGAGQVIKLIINSIYGKLAQSVGYSSNRKPTIADYMDHSLDSGKPGYQSFIWAGMITSGCRGMILDAMYKSNGGVISIATDGILSTTPIPGLDFTDGKFGAWDQEYYTDMYLIQSGIMIGVKEGTVDDAMILFREREELEKKKEKSNSEKERLEFLDKWINKNLLNKTRGFNFREMPPYIIIDGWNNPKVKMDEEILTSPEFSRFINHKTAMMRNNSMEVIGQWLEGLTREIDFNPNRRVLRGEHEYDPELEFDPMTDVWLTDPLDNDEPSSPFKKKTERTELDDREFGVDEFIDDIDYI